MVTFNRLTDISRKQFIGLRKQMSFANNTTPLLWREFMPRRKEITGAVSSDLYSLQIYPADFFIAFNAANPFDKYALIEVAGESPVPEGMQRVTLPSGKYAVFNYQGKASAAETAFRYIFTEWLPASGYVLDQRPHFEILGEKYKREADDSEEEIWIPIRQTKKR